MAFVAKTDFPGLSTITESALLVRDHNINGSSEKYQPTGGNGAYSDLEVYGDDSAPSNSYGLAKDLELDEDDIVLGAVRTIDKKKYALESIAWGTTGGSPVTFSAVSQEVESDAAEGCTFNVPALTLLKRHHAQDGYGILDLTGAGCEFTTINGTAACTINKDKIAGLKISNDPINGVATVTGEILQTGPTVPTLALKTAAVSAGWKITKKPDCVNPEAAKPTWSFECQLNLTKIPPSTSSTQSQS